VTPFLVLFFVPALLGIGQDIRARFRLTPVLAPGGASAPPISHR
jgi:hypothetical protein